MIIAMSLNDNNNVVKPGTKLQPPRPRARFPMKLRTVLEDASNEGNEHIISWLPNGRAFKVHKPDEFAKVLMKRYFRQSHFRSFTRQLYHYGFERCEAGAFHHPFFQRDDIELSYSMSRKMKGDESFNSGGVTSSPTMFPAHGNGPLNAPFAVPSVAAPAPHSLIVKNLECLEDVRLQKPSLQLDSHSMPYPAMATTFDSSFFSVQKQGHDDAAKPSIDGVKTAATDDLTELMLEPRSIEQMQAEPLSDFFSNLSPSQSEDLQSKLKRYRTV